jgi:hypothetical protein
VAWWLQQKLAMIRTDWVRSINRGHIMRVALHCCIGAVPCPCAAAVQSVSPVTVSHSHVWVCLLPATAACHCPYWPLFSAGTENVPQECQEEVWQFLIKRGKNINANIPLGAQRQHSAPQLLLLLLLLRF